MKGIGEEINTLLDNEYLTGEHRNTVESFRRALLKWGSLSVRQVDYFRSIAENYTEERVRERTGHRHRIREDKDFRERIRIVAEYYSRTGYYRRIAADCLRFLEQPKEYKPCPRFDDVNKMMNNKYAENILESHFGEEKFAVGEMVQVRASLSRDNIQSDSTPMLRKYIWGSSKIRSQQVFIVVEVNSSPLSRSLSYDEKKGGTRWYRLLPLGETDTIEVCEKELKRPTAKLLRGEQ